MSSFTPTDLWCISFIESAYGAKAFSLRNSTAQISSYLLLCQFHYKLPTKKRFSSRGNALNYQSIINLSNNILGLFPKVVSTCYKSICAIRLFFAILFAITLLVAVIMMMPLLAMFMMTRSKCGLLMFNHIFKKYYILFGR